MSKTTARSPGTGRFVIGKRSAAAFGAVEGLKLSPRTTKILAESGIRGESGEATRQRLRDAFKPKS